MEASKPKLDNSDYIDMDLPHFGSEAFMISGMNTIFINKLLLFLKFKLLKVLKRKPEEYG